MEKKHRKYGNVPTRGYHSKKESDRARDLWLLNEAGLIFGLQEQVKFELIPPQSGEHRNERSASYIADFVYHRDGKMVVEDVKGKRTPLYIWQRKLMLHVHGISIFET